MNTHNEDMNTHNEDMNTHNEDMNTHNELIQCKTYKYNTNRFITISMSAFITTVIMYPHAVATTHHE
jgi:hypothetical protein